MSWRTDHALARRRWRGPLVRYDLLKEGIVAVVVVIVLAVVLSALLGAPRMPAVSFQSWATNDPSDFVQTTLTELTGTSETATYGPPYNTQTGQLQGLGWFSPQKWSQQLFGVLLPVDAPQDFVVKPLEAAAGLDPSLQQALAQWNGADAAQREAWSKAALAMPPRDIAIKGDAVTFSDAPTSARSPPWSARCSPWPRAAP